MKMIRYLVIKKWKGKKRETIHNKNQIEVDKKKVGGNSYYSTQRKRELMKTYACAKPIEDTVYKRTGKCIQRLLIKMINSTIG